MKKKKTEQKTWSVTEGKYVEDKGAARTPAEEEAFDLNRHLYHQPRGTISVSKNAKSTPTPPPPARPEGTIVLL